MTLEEAASGVQSMQRGLRKRKSTVEDVKKHIRALHLRLLGTVLSRKFQWTPPLSNHRCPAVRRSASTIPIPTTFIAVRALCDAQGCHRGYTLRQHQTEGHGRHFLATPKSLTHLASGPLLAADICLTTEPYLKGAFAPAIALATKHGHECQC
jgi:hypothetical protein